MKNSHSRGSSDYPKSHDKPLLKYTEVISAFT